MAIQNIIVKEQNISILLHDRNEFISLTDIARFRDSERSDYIIQNWMRNKNTIELIGLWEKLHNPEFKSIEFDGFRNEAGSNSFTLTPKRWIEKTNAIGIITKKGRYGGTYAHQDIAFEWATWISAEFKLYLLMEFQRLKRIELEEKQSEWNVSRTIAKINYHIHTDAIKENLIPKDLSKFKQKYVYANEADLLNIALFGKTASEWKAVNPDENGNIRDAASLEQLVVLSNLESFNAELIKSKIPAEKRVLQLNKLARDQLKVLLKNKNIPKIGDLISSEKE